MSENLAIVSFRTAFCHHILTHIFSPFFVNDIIISVVMMRNNRASKIHTTLQNACLPSRREVIAHAFQRRGYCYYCSLVYWVYFRLSPILYNGRLVVASYSNRLFHERSLSLNVIFTSNGSRLPSPLHFYSLIQHLNLFQPLRLIKHSIIILLLLNDTEPTSHPFLECHQLLIRDPRYEKGQFVVTIELQYVLLDFQLLGQFVGFINWQDLPRNQKNSRPHLLVRLCLRILVNELSDQLVLVLHWLACFCVLDYQ